MESKTSLLRTFLTTSALFLLIVYCIHPPNLDLAINKLLQPAMFFAVLMSGLLLSHTNKLIKVLVIGVLIMGMISPLRFFVANRGDNLQRFWNTDESKIQSIVDSLSDKPELQSIGTDSKELQYILANVLNAQVVFCNAPCEQANTFIPYSEVRETSNE